MGSISIGLNKALYSDMQPPKSIYSIYEFKAWKPHFTKTYKVELQDHTIFIIEGDVARVLASAKSEYYFDEHGNYINWNIDPGDLVTLPLLTLGKRQISNINEVGN